MRYVNRYGSASMTTGTWPSQTSESLRKSKSFFRTNTKRRDGMFLQSRQRLWHRFMRRSLVRLLAAPAALQRSDLLKLYWGSQCPVYTSTKTHLASLQLCPALSWPISSIRTESLICSVIWVVTFLRLHTHSPQATQTLPTLHISTVIRVRNILAYTNKPTKN